MLSYTSFLSFAVITFCALANTAKAQQSSVADTTIRFNGRKIEIHKSGFLAQLSTDTLDHPLFTEPIHFHIIDSATHKDVPFINQGVTYTQQKHHILQWHAVDSSMALRMTVDGFLQKNSIFSFTVILSALQDIHLDDIKLHIPFIKEANFVDMCGGGKGDILRDTIDWKWPPKRLIWGMLVGDSTTHLNISLYNTFHKPYVPGPWANDGKGGIWIGTKGKSMLAENYNGPRSLRAGDSLRYSFSIGMSPKYFR